MTEDQFRDRIVRPQLRVRGAVEVVYPKTRYAKAGVSDLLVCYRGRFIAIELKSPDKSSYDVTPLQVAFHRDIINAGGRAIVARTWEEISVHLDVIDLV